MLISVHDFLFYMLIGLLIYIAGALTRLINNKLSYGLEIILAFSIILYIFYNTQFTDSFFTIAVVSLGYFLMTHLLEGHGKYTEIRKKLSKISYTQLTTPRHVSRLVIDGVISIIVFAGATLFLIFGPIYSPLKIVIVIGIAFAIIELIKRCIVYYSTTIYLSEETNELFIVSLLKSRQLPLDSLLSIQTETSTDVLKLHPYLTLFSSHADFTTHVHKVLRLEFPGESIYINLKNHENWMSFFSINSMNTLAIDSEKTVLPFYHRSNMKRLIGKLYFAMTVKGVSAYTGFILLLYVLKTPTWLIIILTLLFWFINLYVSDNVLKAAMDAKKVNDNDIIQVAHNVFAKAGIPHVDVYETDSSDYNGLATGMNIGRAMVTLTRATLTLPTETIESILAHEAVHVKKRDVLWSQIIRASLMIGLVLSIFYVVNRITNIEAYTVPLFIGIWLVFILFPIAQSLYLQWMEVRADFLGATYLPGGKTQMATGLQHLATAQDKDLQSQANYSVSEKERSKSVSSLERPPWWVRFIEFQFMPHPPMYWRIDTLKHSKKTWGKSIIKRFIVDKIKESIPFIKR